MGILLYPLLFFDKNVDAVYLGNTMKYMFPQFWNIVGMDPVLRICLVSLINHRDEVTGFAPDHIVLQNIPMFFDPSRIAGLVEKVQVVHACELQELHLTGIPPHVKNWLTWMHCEERVCKSPIKSTKK